MTTFTETQHPRAAAGTCDGGKFVPKARSESDVDLAPAAAEQVDYAAMARQLVERVHARNEAHVGDAIETGEMQLAAIAAMARSAYPWATSIALECSDQEGCTDDMYVVDVRDANGESVDDAARDLREGDWEEDIWMMGFGLWSNTGQETPGVKSRSRGGLMKVDLAAATAAPPPSEIPGPVQAASRGADMIGKYRALHDAGVEDQTAVRDLLADMHHWARANGVDLAEQFEAAGRYADDEESDPLL